MSDLRLMTDFGEDEKKVNTENTTLSKDLSLDKSFKRLFMKKEFLVPILINVIPEYSKFKEGKYLENSKYLEEVEALITPKDNEIVNPKAYSVEDSGKGEETNVSYDVLVDCKLPDAGECDVEFFFFDLEMQRENNPGYSLVKRGVYYNCRLISRQIEALGEESYNQLKPVYSVWIIKNHVPSEYKNSIYRAGLHGGFNNGANASKLNKDLNLINLIFIYLSEDAETEESQDDLIKYLKSVFNKQVVEDCNPYKDYSGKIKKEVDEFMSLEETVKKESKEEGKIEEKLKNIKNITNALLSQGESAFEIKKTLLSFGFTEEDIKSALGG